MEIDMDSDWTEVDPYGVDGLLGRQVTDWYADELLRATKPSKSVHGSDYFKCALQQYYKFTGQPISDFKFVSEYYMAARHGEAIHDMVQQEFVREKRVVRIRPWDEKNPKHLEARRHYEKVPAIEAAGFRYNWTLKYTVEAKGSFLSGLKLVVWTTPCLWFSLGRPKPRHHFVDTFRSVEAPFGRYKWNKNPACIEAWMEPLTTKGNVIFDPFSGSGPVAYACRRLKRNYLSFEIDPKVAEMSRRQIAKANPPLFLLEDISQSQMELNDERKPRRRKLPQTSG
jgi:hypothetical protein